MDVVRNMIVLGLGTGLAMPTFTLAVQNDADPRQIGTVTAAVQFFRSIGSTIGVAVLGTLLATGLTAALAVSLPVDVASALPAGALSALNPQALASPEAAEALRAQLAGVPNGEALFAELMTAMRLALADAIHGVFMVAAIVSAAGVAVAVFLPEKPLRRRHNVSVLMEGAEELAAIEIVAPPIPAEAEPRLVGAGSSRG